MTTARAHRIRTTAVSGCSPYACATRAAQYRPRCHARFLRQL